MFRVRDAIVYTQQRFYLQPDPVLGWANTSDLSYRTSEEFGSLVRIDHNGMIGRPHTVEKPQGTYRILAIGDSFAAGVEVKEDQRFVELIEKQAGRSLGPTEVLNGGVSGYQTDQEVLYYETKGRRFSPDLVLVFAYLGNDIMGSLSRIGTLVVDARKPAFRLENGELVPDSFEPNTMVEGYWGLFAAKPVGPVATVKDFLYRNSSFYRTAADAWFRVRTRPSLLDPPEAIHRRAEPPEAREAWAVVEALFRRLKADVARDGARLGVVVIPHSGVVEPGAWDRILQANSLDPADWDPTLPNVRMAELCARVQIPCLDVTEVLKANAPGVYFARDPHLNARGNQVVADAVVPWMIGLIR